MIQIIAPGVHESASIAYSETEGQCDETLPANFTGGLGFAKRNRQGRTVVSWIIAGLALGYVAHTLTPQISTIQQVLDRLAH